MGGGGMELLIFFLLPLKAEKLQSCSGSRHLAITFNLNVEPTQWKAELKEEKKSILVDIIHSRSILFCHQCHFA